MFTYISYKIQVTEEILKMLIEDEEYLAVYFSGPCDDPDDEPERCSFASGGLPGARAGRAGRARGRARGPGVRPGGPGDRPGGRRAGRYTGWPAGL